MAGTPYNEPGDYNDDLEMASCSVYDCTGLIPNLALNDSEIQSYEDLYPFLAPMVDPDSEDQNN